MYTEVPDEEAEGDQTRRGVVGGTKLFNRFTLQKVLGRGGMGVVWLARDERLDRLVALKLVPESVCFDPSAHEDLKRETRKSLMLTHPNIVRIFDFIEDERAAAISMEYVDGDTISNLRADREKKVFETYELMDWVKQLAGALDYAHNHGILTNDAPEGGYEGFVNTVDPADTIGVKLQAAGYRVELLPGRGLAIVGSFQ